ncbi:Cytochrome P450 [Mycena indigotica]|uniref:Cytochrome P450 n=1 Tax=Mycena indigotica TaxID=2126181 RepID=A0A8H6SID4_9AGAR|nr:Cytochrome P450 [Mycena indigotica]KAF7299325.1 Cytochrome P450 [Mycena indigotica]
MLLLAVLALLLVLYLIFRDFLALLIRQARSPLRTLSGPPPTSLLTGNLAALHDQENTDVVLRWEAAHGAAFVYRGFVGGRRLLTTDPRALAHILGRAYDYPKPGFVRESLAAMAGGDAGLLVVEGEVHRRQRSILAPAFTAAHVRSLAPVFWAKAGVLRDVWLAAADAAPSPSPPSPSPGPGAWTPPAGSTRIDVLSWLARATLDAVGEAGFGYAFHALSTNEEDEQDELARAFADIFATARRFRVMTILQAWFPILRRFRRNNAVMARATATMQRIGARLVEERSRAVLAAQTHAQTDTSLVAGDKTVLGRDLLSVLIRSNMSAPTPAAALSSAEVLSQIATFIATGHETVASALTWALYALVRAPAVQARLRAGLHALETSVRAARPGAPDAALRDALTDAVLRDTYLEHVLREVLRLHAPIANTMRVAARDDVIPLSASPSDADAGGLGLPPARDRAGNVLSCIRVRRGDIITVPIQAVNKSRAIWGPDAGEFDPERWADGPGTAGGKEADGRRRVPGLWAHTLTFLNGNGGAEGNRACIGWRYALAEMKIMLFVLVRDLEFALDPATVIEKRVNVVTRPFVRSEPALGNQMPLHVRRHVHALPALGAGAE